MRRLAYLTVVAALCVTGCSTVYMKGTPLYTGEDRASQAPPEDRVNLWPLLYYHKPSLSVVWPLAEWTDDHMALRPLFSVYKLDKPKHQYNVVAPLFQFDFAEDAHRIFPVFWGDDYLVGFPIVWWLKDTKGIFPVFWGEDGWAIFPLFWYSKDAFCHLFPLWIHSTGKERRDTHILWPIFRSLSTLEKGGFRIWPLVGSYTSKPAGDWHNRYLLWPLVRDYRDGDERSRAVLPVFIQSRNKDEGWWLLLPFAFRWEKGNERLTLTPLWSSSRRGDDRWSALLPFYYHRANTAKQTSRTLTPVFGWSRSPERTSWQLVPLLSSLAWGKGEKELWLLGPLAHARWGSEKLQHHVAPLYLYDREEGMFLSPLVSWKRKEGERHLNILGPLFHASRYPTGLRTWHVLAPLGRLQRGPGSGNWSARLWPLFSWSRQVSQAPAGEAESPPRWAGALRRTRFALFPWFSVSRERTEEERPPSGKGPAVVEIKRRARFWPFWVSSSTSLDDATTGERHSIDSNARLLGWVYDARHRDGQHPRSDKTRKPPYTRRRLLVRIAHFERLEGDSSLDLFPFVTWDSKADGYRQLSFMWRFFRDERTPDGGHSLDFFFLPLVRKKGAEATR